MNTWTKKGAALPARLALSLFLGLACWLPTLLWAEVPDRVGRIAYLSGDVQFYSEAGQGWVPAELNAPVTSRNSLFTRPDGRAEIRFGSTAATLDGNTQLDIQELDDQSFKARISRGSVNFRLATLETFDAFSTAEIYEITASPARYQFLQAGRYRVDADNGTSRVTVIAGQVKASLSGREVLLGAGKSLSVSTSGEQLAAVRRTALDDFAAQRDEALRASEATRYVSPNMTGVEELDLNGRWASDPDYGTVWYPTTYVSPDWVPYRDGHWSYVAPWGWTWIDAAPWGFAPFHYGRWVRIGSSWAWTPGTYVKRPSYAPALVAFIGGVPGASISVGVQPFVSWYPLSPWESYRPAYRHSNHHLNNINNFSIKEPPAYALPREGNHALAPNRLHGKTEVPHASFVDPRPHRQPVAPFSPALSAPAGRGSAMPSGVPRTEPNMATRSDPGLPSNRGRTNFGEKLPGQEPWLDPAARTRRNPAEGMGAPFSRSAEPLPRTTPNESLPQSGPSGDRFGRERPPSDPIARPKIPEAAPVLHLESPVPRPAIPTPYRNPPEQDALRRRLESPAAHPEPRLDFQNRSRGNSPEAQRDPRRDPEKERPGEGRGREPGPR